MKEEKVYVCPVADVTCPYFKYGNCSMYPENHPMLECDEVIAYIEETDDCDNNNETWFDFYLGCYSGDY